MNQISLRIHSVKCVDETGGKWAEKVGNDEISLSGFGVDANATTTKVGAFGVYPHFDDGDIKTYSPPRKFVTLNLTNTTTFPKTCSVGFLLAETDGGGLAGAVEKAFAKIKEELGKKKSEEVQSKRMTPAAIAAINWGVLWATVKPFVYDFIKNKIISGLSDDVFPPKDVSVTINSANFTWNGNKISPPSAVEFRGHDGVYLMTYDWELS